jgi:D-glycero-D-manno-heptose 1,7-bisphosphate phosphatase
LLKQAVFLVGGLGTRLRNLTQNTPKPLIAIHHRPFLDILIEEAARWGFTDILLLGGYLGEQMTARYDGRSVRGATVRVLIEPEPLGTGGALKFALRHLAERFLLANGDTFFDINLRALAADIPISGGVMALRSGVEGTRYGRVGLDAGYVRSFYAPGGQVHGPINGGIYALDRAIVARLGDGPVSLESTVFPQLAKEGLLRGQTFENYFIDIGIPEDLDRARADLPSRLTRPALFLDRDGVLNVEKGYLHRREDLCWMQGARETVRLANDKGWFVFVVTNQAGVARGYYEESDIHTLHSFMQEDLAATGAHIDAFEYCPHHPDGTRPGYDKACDRRKPKPGMIRDLLKTWPVDAAKSFMIGDMPHDVAAAKAAGIRGHQFPGGDLLGFAAPLMRNADTTF